MVLPLIRSLLALSILVLPVPSFAQEVVALTVSDHAAFCLSAMRRPPWIEPIFPERARSAPLAEGIMVDGTLVVTGNVIEPDAPFRLHRFGLETRAPQAHSATFVVEAERYGDSATLRTDPDGRYERRLPNPPEELSGQGERLYFSLMPDPARCASILKPRTDAGGSGPIHDYFISQIAGLDAMAYCLGAGICTWSQFPFEN